MSLALYMDHHVPRAIATSLRHQGLDILTAYEDGAHEIGDPELLDRANFHGRVLFTQDTGFLGEAVSRQRSEETFQGLIYAHPLRVSIGEIVQDLELIPTACEANELRSQIVYLPI
jgi:hypothetical protein